MEAQVQVGAKLDGEGEPDWALVILEVQTDPAGPSSAALGQLFRLIYGYIQTLAKFWLKRNRRLEGQYDDLAAFGWDKVTSGIEKFDIPNDAPVGVGRAFKGWVGTCCEREWTRLGAEQRELAVDPAELSDLALAPSPEQLVCAEEESPVDSPDLKAKQFVERLLQQEMAKLLEPMREAVMETEDCKSVANPQARGKAGESAAIAAKHGLTQNAVRTARSRLVQRVKDRFDKEFSP